MQWNKWKALYLKTLWEIIRGNESRSLCWLLVLLRWKTNKQQGIMTLLMSLTMNMSACVLQLLSDSQINMVKVVNSVSDALNAMQKENVGLKARVKADLQRAPVRGARFKGCSNGKRNEACPGCVSLSERDWIFFFFLLLLVDLSVWYSVCPSVIHTSVVTYMFDLPSPAVSCSMSRSPPSVCTTPLQKLYSSVVCLFTMYSSSPASPADISMPPWAASHPHYPVAFEGMWIFFFFFTVHEIWLACPLRRVSEKQRRGPEASSHWKAFNQAQHTQWHSPVGFALHR